MKSRSLLAFVCLCGLASATVDPFRPALPGYRYRFPHDYFNHPDYQTEWWYYTGNVKTADGHRFGFELTFFRQGLERGTKPANVWDAQDAWLAHLALSDIDGQHFYHTERLNRSGPGLAGADESQARVWNGNWQVQWIGEMERLQAVADDFGFVFSLQPLKPPVIHGIDGVSQKAEGAGHASHYFSQTRLAVAGALDLHRKSFAVQGLAWMDHEFFSHQLAAHQTGWDWMSLQLDNGSELMLFRLRPKDGSVDPYSAGTYIDQRGKSRHLSVSDFQLTPESAWTSPSTGGKYPIQWRIRAPSLGLDLNLLTRLPQQELTSDAKASLTYWEGAIEVIGSATGVGYLEMTGYTSKLELQP